MKKSTRKTVLICAIFMAVTMLLGFVTAGFQQWSFIRKVNPDNLYTAECVTLEDDKDGKLKIDVKEKTGAIILDGKSGDEDETYEIGKIDLEAGTYTLTAIEDASLEKVYVTITANQTEYKFDIKGENTITLDADAEDCVITLHVMAEVEFEDLEILPVIVEGDEAADFYA